MGKKLSPYEVQGALRNRLHLVTDFCDGIARAERQDAVIQKVLHAAVPRSMRELVTNESIINMLFNYGYYSTYIPFTRSGFKDYKAVKKAAGELQRAWAEQIIVTLDDEGEVGRVSIRFTAAQP